jgi:hypothetical protein
MTTISTETVFQAAQLPPDHEEMFNLNYNALQLNVLSDKLRGLIPPTDSRLRQDINHWEQGDT